MFQTISLQLKSTLIAGFYWLYSHLWRLKEFGHFPNKIPGEGRLYAHWHGDELVLIRISAFRRMAIMASTSRDGELMRRILLHLGFRVVRGSSTRGGAAGLKGLIDYVRKEKVNASLAVDGPRGPIYRVKPGILKLAQETGLPIIPGASAAKHRFLFKKAWNRCYLPLPFSKVVVLYGSPIHVPENLSDSELEQKRLEVELRLTELKAQAEAHFEKISNPELVPDGA